MSSKRPANILVIGSINMDLVVRTSRIPRPGQTVLGGSFLTVPGGKGANQAVAAARLGAPCKLLGRVGHDAFGARLVDHLRGSGVDLDLARVVEDSATGVALIMVDEKGENAICVASGANQELSVAEVEAASEAISWARVCLLQLEVPVAAVVRAIELCRRLGVTSVLDPAPAPSGPAKELFEADIVSPNATEAELLTGMRMDVGDGESVRAVAKRLWELGAGQVVLKLGSGGAAYFDGKRFESIAGHSIEAVDTTAAGDAFTAALGVGIARGEAPRVAARFANAAGAAACLTLGAQPSMPTHQKVMRLLNSGK